MLCSGCAGSGEIVGLGHIKAICYQCKGTRKAPEPEQEVMPKDSQQYQEAKSKIQEGTQLSEKQAEAILDEEISKLSKSKSAK